LKRLGEYELLRKIGAGGMAEVWMGRRAALAGASKAVAIKLLARDVLDDPAYRQMFIEEARLSMLLTNSNVVQVFDVGEIDGECFMVMEWVDGLNLSELARKMQGQAEKLSTVVAAHVVGEVLRGLAYAHGLHHDGSKATIVHRDVSPQNVLVSVSGEVKLADFGVARLAREETSGLHVKGKLRYMAPEQLRGRSREPTVDLYAVGAILHELLEGQRFRVSRDEGDLYAMVLSGEYPPLSSDVPPALVRLHAGLLEPDPARRIQTADEALELLYSWPGYRNSSVELGRLVRRWIGVAAPRSGILHSDVVAAARGTDVVARGGAASSAETLDAPTRAASGPVGSGPVGSGPVGSGPIGSGAVHSAVTSIESGPLDDRGATETHTFVETAPETEATAMIAEGQVPARRPAASMLIGAAMALALSFGVFGLGFPLGWWGGSTAPTVAEVAETGKTKTEEAGEVEPPKVVEETKVEPPKVVVEETTETGDLETDGETGSQVAIPPPGEDESGGGQDDKGDTEVIEQPKKTAPAPKATVTFNTGNFTFVWVKVAGKELALEPAQDIRLKPGKYTVYFRGMDDTQWKPARPKIEVQPGKKYFVQMVKPAGLTIKPL